MLALRPGDLTLAFKHKIAAHAIAQWLKGGIGISFLADFTPSTFDASSNG